MADLSDRIETVAGEPAAAANDTGSATNQDISKLIEADKYLAGRTATTGTNANGGPRSGWGALRQARTVPPGSV